MALAVVSANAFDKGLDNDTGIAQEDFIVKPVRHTELLDWLEKRLQLIWLDSAFTDTLPAAVDVPPQWVWPDGAALTALLEVVNLGFYRGVLNQLARVETAQPDSSSWVNDLLWPDSFSLRPWAS